MFYQKMFLRSISLLSLSVLTLINGGLSATAQIKLPLEINIDVKEKEAKSSGGGSNTNNERLCPNNDNSKQELISKTVPLYYLRQPTAIKGIVEDIIKKDPSFKNAIVESKDNVTDLVLFGCRSEIEKMERIIATLDVPLQGITMEMWGIQISSSNPEKLSKALIEINQEINKTQQLMKATYRELEKMAIAIEVDPTYKDILEQDLGYLTALQIYDELSMADILLRINAAKDPHQNALVMRQKMKNLFDNPQSSTYDSRYYDYVEYLSRRGQQPFERFLQAVGLEKRLNNDCQEKILEKNCWKDRDLVDNTEGVKTQVEFLAIRGKQALLRFAMDYGYSIHEPNEFDGQRLQETSEAVNARIRLLANAINQDVADLFIEPTLEKIQAIVRKHKDVEYALVGKTKVASLDGSKSIVDSTTVSSFAENPPLRLADVINDAAEIKGNVEQLVPPVPVPAGATPIPVPRESIISLLAALSQDRSSWRALTDGVSLDVIPNILRNASSAELDFNITFGPNQPGTVQGENSGYSDSEPKVRPLSRIGQQTVTTKVYVDTFDLFALSTFNSQSTKDGGRSYIPLVGTIWQGVFSGIPVFGDLFSWKNAPKNVHHQSIILTNSFIVPTSMSLAILYQPTQSETERDFYKSCENVIYYLQEDLKGERNAQKWINNVCPRFIPKDTFQSPNDVNWFNNQLDFPPPNYP